MSLFTLLSEPGLLSRGQCVRLKYSQFLSLPCNEGHVTIPANIQLCPQVAVLLLPGIPVLSHLIFTFSRQRGYYTHFTGEETEVQISEPNFLKVTNRRQLQSANSLH